MNTSDELERILREYINTRALEKDRIMRAVEMILNGVRLLTGEDDTLDLPDQQSEQSVVTPKPPVRITAENVRDAVLAMHRKPPAAHKDPYLKHGYFTVRHIAGHIGCSTKSGHLINAHLHEMLDKELLAEQPYKSGRQYKYRPAPEDKITTKIQNDPGWKANAVQGTGNSRTSGNSEVSKILKKLPSHFKVERTGGSHIRVGNTETGQTTTISATPSDTNAVNQIKRSLRDIGAIWL